jgi:hypothetical protein
MTQHGPPPGLPEEKLYTGDGELMTTALTPPWQIRPEVAVWGERLFVLREGKHGLAYYEARGMFAVIYVADDDPTHSRIHPSACAECGESLNYDNIAWSNNKDRSICRICYGVKNQPKRSG